MASLLFGQCLAAGNARKLQENDLDCVMGNEYAQKEFGLEIKDIPCQLQANVEIDNAGFKNSIQGMLYDPNNGSEEDCYFYHSDHLGSASWITERHGDAVQHLQYLPYGERYVDQRVSGYHERFTFTGKERDEETGYGYFGARYMDHELMTMWLSVDPDGLEVMDNDDEWKVDKLNRTISRVGLNGGNSTQFVEGDGVWIRNESRGDLLNDYKGYTVIDNMSSEAQLNPTEEREKTDAISAGAIAGTIVSSVGQGSRSMSKALFDKENGTYMGKDGSTKPIMQGKNGGLNGRYKSQIKAAAKYAKLGRVCTAAGLATALVSADNTERQYKNGQISNMRRLTNHAVDILGCTPVGWMAPFAYELGANYGPSTWLKK